MVVDLSPSSLVIPGTVGAMSSVCVCGGGFLRDNNPYLREFRQKPRKTAVDKRDQESNPVPLVYQFRV